MGKIYFHIGMPKTGTSAIQAFLTINEDILEDKGYKFPNPPNLDKSCGFQESCGNGFDIAQLIFNKNIEKLETILDEFKNAKEDIIISSEYLIAALIDQVDLVIQLIKKYNIVVIVYIRKQDDFKESEYNQSVKNHGEFREISVDEEIMPYYVVIEKLMESIQKENLIIRPYEREQFIDHDILADFLNCIGLVLDENYKLPNKIVNPSLTVDTLEFRKSVNSIPKYAANHLTPNMVILNKLILDYVVNSKYKGEAFKGNVLLTSSDRRKILDLYKDYNRNVAEFIGKEDGNLFLNNNEKDGKVEEVTIDDFLDISKYLIKTHNNEKYDENVQLLYKELKKFIANFTTDIVTDFGIKNVYEFANKSVYRKLYTLEETPTEISAHVESINYYNGELVITSNGNDPFFILTDIENDFSKNLFVKLEIESKVSSFIEIFYAGIDENFTGDNKVDFSINRGINSMFLCVEHDQIIDKLRFDIGNFPADYIINHIEIYAM